MFKNVLNVSCKCMHYTSLYMLHLVHCTNKLWIVFSGQQKNPWILLTLLSQNDQSCLLIDSLHALNIMIIQQNTTTHPPCGDHHPPSSNQWLRFCLFLRAFVGDLWRPSFWLHPRGTTLRGARSFGVFLVTFGEKRWETSWRLTFPCLYKAMLI